MKGLDALEPLRRSLEGLFRRAQGLIRPLEKFFLVSLLDGVLVPRKGVCVGIGKGWLSVVSGSRFMSRVKLGEEKVYSFEDNRFVPPESVASTLALAMEEMKIRSADVALSVPKDWVAVRTVHLPSTAREVIGDVIRFEFDRFTPFPADEALYDYRIIGQENGRLHVSMAAVRLSVVKPYLEALRAKGINPSRVIIGPSALGTLGFFITNREDIVCAQITESGYAGCTVISGSPATPFSKEVPSGADNVLPALAQEMGAQRETAAKTGKNPALIFLSDDGHDMSLAAEVQGGLEVVDRKGLGERLGAGSQSVSFFGVGGILESLWPRARGYNLLSMGKEEKKKIPLGVTVALLVLLCGLLVPYGLLPLEREQRRLAEIERQISTRKEEVKRVEALKKEIDALSAEVDQIRAFKESRPMVLVVMKELTSVLPKNAWLTRSRVTDETVETEGYAQSATEILPKLEQSAYFKKAEFSSPTIRDTRLNADRFVIKMEQEGVAKKQPEKPKDDRKK